MIEPLEVGVDEISYGDLFRFAADLEREGVGWEGVREAKYAIILVFWVGFGCACSVLSFASFCFNIYH
jgi:hypothetical protein